MRRTRGQLNASTEHVLNETLARVITLDGVCAPNALSFDIPTAWIPSSMYQRAADLVEYPEKWILYQAMVKNSDDSVSHEVYYVLSQSQTKYTRISKALVDRRERYLSIHLDTS